MKIKEGTYYHIYRKKVGLNIWQKNSTIIIGKKEPNPFSRFYDNNSQFIILPDKSKIHLYTGINYFFKQANDFQAENYEKYLKKAQSAIKEQGMFIREKIFEEIRSNYFPDLPSRTSCIFLCEKESTNFWYKTLKGEKLIYEVSINGIVHRADQKFLVFDTVDHNFLRACAFKYWSGTDDINPKEIELLFEGIIEVKEKFEYLEIFKKNVIGE